MAEERRTLSTILPVLLTPGSAKLLRSTVRRPRFPVESFDFWSMTNEQGGSVSVLSQRGISSQACTPGLYSELESILVAWDREYLSFDR